LKDKPRTEDILNLQEKPGARNSKKKLLNLFGGAALTAAIAFSAPSMVGQGALTYAQTATATTTAAPSTSSTTPTAQPSQSTTGSSTPTTGMPVGPAGAPGPAGGPPAGPDGGPGGLSGFITTINGSTITLKQNSVITIQATVNDNTVYNEAGTSIKLSDLAVGEKVRIRTAVSSDGTVSVAGVEVVLDRTDGTISAIDSGSLTLTRPDGSTTKVALGSSVSVQDLGKSSAVSNLKTGQKVEVAGQLGSDGTLTAQVINVQYEHLGGQVKAISGNTITVEVGVGPDGLAGPAVPPAPPSGSSQSTATATPSSTSAASTSTTTTKTITVSDSTAYMTADQSGKLSDIAVGDRIDAQGTASSDGSSFTALSVTVHLPHYHGQVTTVDGSTITLKDGDTTRTILINGDTKYLNGTSSAALSDVKSGEDISAEGKVDTNGQMTAMVIQVGHPAGPPVPGM